MDFLNRSGNQPTHNSSQTVVAGTKRNREMDGQPTWLKVASVVLLFSLTVLAVGVATLFFIGNSKESVYVNKDLNQAVFLSNGQVYFGKIQKLNDKYIDLRSIYYLNSQNPSSSSTTANTSTNFTLVKLGCELHGPADEMIINRSQVSFWENLRSDGKVAKAIDQWVKANPNGLTCTDTNSSGTTQQSPATTK